MVEKIEADLRVLKLLNQLLETDETPATDGGVSKEDFQNQMMPNTNIDRVDSDVNLTAIHSLNSIKMLACAKMLNATKCTNALLYHPNSMMEWHTNSDVPGTRIYYIYTEGESVFKYLDDSGKEVIDYDNIGWTVRKFTVPSDKLLWHTIWTEKKRYAFGFNIENDIHA